MQARDVRQAALLQLIDPEGIAVMATGAEELLRSYVTAEIQAGRINVVRPNYDSNEYVTAEHIRVTRNADACIFTPTAECRVTPKQVGEALGVGGCCAVGRRSQGLKIYTMLCRDLIVARTYDAVWFSVCQHNRWHNHMQASPYVGGMQVSYDEALGLMQLLDFWAGGSDDQTKSESVIRASPDAGLELESQVGQESRSQSSVLAEEDWDVVEDEDPEMEIDVMIGRMTKAQIRHLVQIIAPNEVKNAFAERYVLNKIKRYTSRDSVVVDPVVQGILSSVTPDIIRHIMSGVGLGEQEAAGIQVPKTITRKTIVCGWCGFASSIKFVDGVEMRCDCGNMASSNPDVSLNPAASLDSQENRGQHGTGRDHDAPPPPPPMPAHLSYGGAHTYGSGGAVGTANDEKAQTTGTSDEIKKMRAEIREERTLRNEMQDHIENAMSRMSSDLDRCIRTITLNTTIMQTMLGMRVSHTEEAQLDAIDVAKKLRMVPEHQATLLVELEERMPIGESQMAAVADVIAAVHQVKQVAKDNDRRTQNRLDELDSRLAEQEESARSIVKLSTSGERKQQISNYEEVRDMIRRQIDADNEKNPMWGYKLVQREPAPYEEPAFMVDDNAKTIVVNQHMTTAAIEEVVRNVLTKEEIMSGVMRVDNVSSSVMSSMLDDSKTSIEDHSVVQQHVNLFEELARSARVAHAESRRSSMIGASTERQSEMEEINWHTGGLGLTYNIPDWVAGFTDAPFSKYETVELIRDSLSGLRSGNHPGKGTVLQGTDRDNDTCTLSQGGQSDCGAGLGATTEQHGACYSREEVDALLALKQDRIKLKFVGTQEPAIRWSTAAGTGGDGFSSDDGVLEVRTVQTIKGTQVNRAAKRELEAVAASINLMKGTEWETRLAAAVFRNGLNDATARTVGDQLLFGASGFVPTAKTIMQRGGFNGAAEMRTFVDVELGGSMRLVGRCLATAAEKDPIVFSRDILGVAPATAVATFACELTLDQFLNIQ